MIPFSGPATKSGDWQEQLRQGFRSVPDLLEYLELERLMETGRLRAAKDFPLRVTRYYAGLMNKGDTDDPLLLQVLPSSPELESSPGFTTDPTGDLQAHGGHGLLRKYHGRALVIATASCAIHCRYCFRRHYPYGEGTAHPGDWTLLLERLGQDPSLSEVILSGGDPLMLSNNRLEELLQGLQALPHIRRLRIHTRLPVVLPNRIDEQLVGLLADSTLKCTLVLHANHPREITPELGTALRPLQDAGIVLLNQSVLLKGINDQLDLQTELCEKLFEYNVLPYYLHVLDKVSGAAHFQTPRSHAIRLHQAMRERLPGYLLPRLVEERPGARAKMPL